MAEQNGIFTTIAGGSVIVWLIGNIKTMWHMLVVAVKSVVSFDVVNTYEDKRCVGWSLTPRQMAFNELVADSKSIWERTRNLDLSDQYQEAGKKTLAYGFSIKIVLGRLAFCRRTIDRQQTVTSSTVLTVFFTRQRKFMKMLDSEIDRRVQEIALRAKQARDYVCVYSRNMCDSCQKYKRRIDSIFTNDGQHKELLASIKAFLDNKETYRKLSYPYSYSALLHGSPGCGKTSTILAIASELNMDIKYISLSKIDMSDLLCAITQKNTILVFEDIDAMASNVTRNRSDDEPAAEFGRPKIESNVSLSDMLNITDGLLAADGSICLFTTNHVDKLDPALIRAGRMNKVVEFSCFNKETARNMVKANLGVDVDGLKDGIRPADLQSTILDILLGRATVNDLKKRFCEGK